MRLKARSGELLTHDVWVLLLEVVWLCIVTLVKSQVSCLPVVKET